MGSLPGVRDVIMTLRTCKTNRNPLISIRLETARRNLRAIFSARRIGRTKTERDQALRFARERRDFLSPMPT